MSVAIFHKGKEEDLPVMPSNIKGRIKRAIGEGSRWSH